MQVLMTEEKGAAVIKLVGKMMLGYEANDFHEAVLKAIEKNNKNIVVDLSAVEFMSSWGIGILMYGYTTATNNKVTFKLAAVPQKVNDTLRKVKLDSIIEQFDTIEKALML